MIHYAKISVDDELPPIDTAVFCFGRKGHKMVCYLSHFDNGSSFRRTHNNNVVSGITHWIKETSQ